MYGKEALDTLDWRRLRTYPTSLLESGDRQDLAAQTRRDSPIEERSAGRLPAHWAVIWRAHLRKTKQQTA